MAETSLVALPASGLWPVRARSFSQDVMDAINLVVSTQNANNTSLRAGITSAIQIASVNITLAQLLTLFSAPLQLIPAGASGTIIEVLSAVLKWVRGSAAFTIGSAGNITLNYKADASGAAATVALAATGFFDQSASQIRIIKALATNLDVTGLTAQPIVLTVATADMTAGTGGSAVIDVAYRVHSGF